MEDDWYLDKNGRVVWNDNVTSKINVPEGGTYIGPYDNDILKYYGICEKYEKFSMTKWGFSLNGISLEFDHNGKPYPNQRPWLVPTIPSDYVEGYLTSSVDVSFDTDEVSGTNKTGKTFEGITFRFLFLQTARSLNFEGFASIRTAAKLHEEQLKEPDNRIPTIRSTDVKQTQAYITIPSEELIQIKETTYGHISAGVVNNSVWSETVKLELETGAKKKRAKEIHFQILFLS